MSTFIPIDRASIRRNKRAGQAVSFFPGVPSAEMEVAFLVRGGMGEQDRLIGALAARGDEMGHHAVRQRVSEGVCYVEFAATPKKDLEEDFKALARMAEQFGAQVVREACRLEMHVPQHPVHHAPIPRFSFTHVPTEVACEECGARFPHNELQSEESDDGEWYSARVCPKCGAFECCDLEYERLTDEMTAGVTVEA